MDFQQFAGNEPGTKEPDPWRNQIDEFESRLLAGENPRIENFLSEIEHQEALEELVKIEIEYRAKRNDVFSITDYCDRFPQIDIEVQKRLRETYAKFANRSVGNPIATSETDASGKLPEQSSSGSDSLLTAKYLPGMQGSTDQPLVPPHGAGKIDHLTGSTLGPYEIVAKLGEGGMGAVYKARHLHLDKIVAIKVLSLHLVQEADAVARFKREMKAVGQLEHPNIIRAMDAGEVEGSLYLAMEYVEGSDLQKLIKQRGPMEVGPACRALLQAAQAMAVAHKAGLVHRDLKPANLLLTETGQIKVLDLGLARLAADQFITTELTTAGQVFGTPDYMPPEQWDDVHNVDPRADLYSLGCTLFFLLVGRAPYSAKKHNSISAKMKAHVVDPIPDLRSACPIELPDSVVQIYEQLLAKRPDDRIQTADLLAEALTPLATETGSVNGTASVLPVDKKAGSSVSRRMSLGWWFAGPAFLLLLILMISGRKSDVTPKLWLPDELQVGDFKASKNSQRCRIHDRIFETQLVRTIANKEVLFQLVPEFEIPKKDKIIRTFYIMETPVSNAMFNLFATENPLFEMVQRSDAQRTWKSNPDQPVVNVHPLEAQQFALWLVPDLGSLPTTAEWDLASGYYDFIGLLKDQAKPQVPFDVMLVGQNCDTAAKFKVGSGPGVGEFQPLGEGNAIKNRSPYGCSYPSRTTTDFFEFSEMTATVKEVEQDRVEDLREWTRDPSKVKLGELESIAGSQLRMLIKHQQDFHWINPEGDETKGVYLTVKDLDEISGELYLNPGEGGVGFNRNTGFRVVILTKSPVERGPL